MEGEAEEVGAMMKEERKKKEEKGRNVVQEKMLERGGVGRRRENWGKGENKEGRVKRCCSGGTQG